MHGLRGWLSGFALFLLSPIGYSSQAQQSPASPAPTLAADSAMISLATLVLENAKQIDAVWPGFWSVPEFILHRSHRVALLHTPGKPFPGYKPLQGEHLPAVLRTKTYISTQYPAHLGERSENPPYARNLDLDDRRTYDVHVLSVTDGLLHESFHRWQYSVFKKREKSCVPQWYTRDLPLPEGFRDAVARELRLLANAVGHEEEPSIRAGAKEYLRHRMQRLSGALPLVTHIEQRQELLEGPARFVGNAAHLLLHEHSLARLPQVLASALEALHTRALNPKVHHGSEQQGRMYGAGAAMAYLLERLHAPQWRVAAQQGRPLDELLAERIGFDEYLAWRHALPAAEESCLPKAPRT